RLRRRPRPDVIAAAASLARWSVVDTAAGATETAVMPRYKITVTAQLASPIGVDAVRLRAMTGGSVKVIAPDIARIVLTRTGTDESCAANKAVMDISRAVSPL